MFAFVSVFVFEFVSVLLFEFVFEFVTRLFSHPITGSALVLMRHCQEQHFRGVASAPRIDSKEVL